MANVIHNKLPSGETQSIGIKPIDIGLCIEESNRIFSNLYDKEGTIDGLEFGCVVFNMFLECIPVLKDYGWTDKELQSRIEESGPLSEVEGEWNPFRPIEKLEKQIGCDLS